MKDFPNYLLPKKNNDSAMNIKSSNEQVWKDTTFKKSFQPSNVPSILKGLTRENHLDYTDIKLALRLKNDDILLFETNNQLIDCVTVPQDRQSSVKKTGLHRTFQQLMVENENNHFILTKGDTHER